MKITAKQAKEILYNETREFEIIEHNITYGGRQSEGSASFVFAYRGRYFQLILRAEYGPLDGWIWEYQVVDEFECPEVRIIIEYTKTYKFEKI